jgi:hypothetical protein
VTVDLAAPKMRSYSAMTTYMECPRQYELKYVEHLRDEPAVWNIGGTAFHQCAEWYLTGDHTPGAFDFPQDAWNLAWHLAKEEVFERNPDADPDVRNWRAANQGREHIDWWMREGPAMVERFIAWRAGPGASLTVADDGVEHRFEVEFDGVPVVAIPDALVYDEYGQLNILDWKSGRRPPKSTLQLAVYRAAVLYGRGEDAVWGHYYLTRKAVLLPHDLTVWQPEQIVGMFVDFDARVNAGWFDPKPGDACKFCPATTDQCQFSMRSPA